MKKAFILIIGFFLVVYHTQGSIASDFSTQPTDIVSFENNLNNSIVEVLCGGLSGVGFSANYNIKQEFKDSGFNSLILTTATNTFSCRFYNSSVFLTFKGKKDNGNIWFWNGQSSDFSLVQSHLSIPPLNLYGEDLPQEGWWVDVVQNVPGFGLVWKHSIVRLVNAEKMIFTVDAISPNITDNALVFNNQGTFLGVLSSYQVTEPTGQVIVQGAPLQCQLSKSDSTPTVTNCGKFASQIWKSPASSTADALPANQTAISAYNTATDELENLTTAVQDCTNFFGSDSTYIADFFSKTNYLTRCDGYSNRGTQAIARISLKDGIPVSSLDTINSIHTQIQNLVQAVSDQIATLANEKDEALSIVNSYQGLLDGHNSVSAVSQGFLEIMNVLSPTIRNKIKQAKSWKSASAQFAKENAMSSQLNVLNESLGGISNIAGLRKFANQVKQTDKNLHPASNLKNVPLLLKLFPQNICVDGASLHIPVNRTCLVGKSQTTADYVNSLIQNTADGSGN